MNITMKEVSLNDYQKMAMETAIYPLPIIYQHLGWQEKLAK